MADLAHWIGSDLTLSSTGGLLPIDGIVRGQQRVVRRLLTVGSIPSKGIIGTYWHHLTYGAGVQLDIGTAADVLSLKAKIAAQIFAEPAVALNPQPIITIQPLGDTTGLFVQITYTDNASGQLTSTSFRVTP